MHIQCRTRDFRFKSLFLILYSLGMVLVIENKAMSYNCQTDLMEALVTKQAPMVIRQIISRGADVNAVDFEFLRCLKPVLRYALDRGSDKESVEIIKMLIAAGANVNKITYNRVTDKNVYGMMPLLTYAAIYSSAEIVQILVNAGAQDKTVDKSGISFTKTALTIAQELRKSDVVKVLEQIK